MAANSPGRIYNESVIAGGATADTQPQSIEARVQVSSSISLLCAPEPLNSYSSFSSGFEIGIFPIGLWLWPRSAKE